MKMKKKTETIKEEKTFTREPKRQNNLFLKIVDGVEDINTGKIKLWKEKPKKYSR